MPSIQKYLASCESVLEVVEELQERDLSANRDLGYSLMCASVVCAKNYE